VAQRARQPLRVNIRQLALLAARLLAAAALLALVAWLVGVRGLIEQLRRVDPVWFALAVVAMAASQWVSAGRWVSIAAILGLRAPARDLRLAYAQSMAVNVVLPGATLGGDTLRSVRLQRLGNPLGESALSVVLDRASGLWILCLLSLCTGLGLLASGHLDRASLPAAAAGIDVRSVVWIYLGALSAAVALPFVPLRRRRLPGGPGDRRTDLHRRGRASVIRRLWRPRAGLAAGISIGRRRRSHGGGCRRVVWCGRGSARSDNSPLARASNRSSGRLPSPFRQRGRGRGSHMIFST
jgi:uncharacterized membrane protein YbhN (UPF0104 family)